MKHSGKSTLGRRLAGRWGCPFHDTDEFLEAFYAASGAVARIPTREIYTKLGPDRFFDAEAAALADLASRLGGGSHVIAAGGRTPLNPAARPLLRALGLAVLLEVPAEALWRRVVRGGIPAFVGPQDPRGEFLALARAREPEYRRFADLVVELDPEGTVEENEQRLCAAIEARETQAPRGEGSAHRSR
jgi:shikimate kinase